MKWKNVLIKNVKSQLSKDPNWSSMANKMLGEPEMGIHLAIFNEPFLSLIFTGQKKIESRFSINNISPFRKVSKGDIIVLKESGGLITGVFVAGEVMYFSNLDEAGFKNLDEKYGNLICSNYDKDFWKKRQNTRYVTLIDVRKVKRLIPFASDKNDRLAWSVLRKGEAANLFNYSK